MSWDPIPHRLCIQYPSFFFFLVGYGGLAKIGYTTFSAQGRVRQLAHDYEYEDFQVLGIFPSENEVPLVFVHLLEKIAHELCARRQVDVFLPCLRYNPCGFFYI